MSGGHFQYNQYRIEEIAASIDREIASNDDTSKDDLGLQRGRGFSPEIIERFKEASHTLRQAAEMAQRVDWLLSGDDGDENFLRRWEEEVRPYWKPSWPSMTKKDHSANAQDDSPDSAG